MRDLDWHTPVPVTGGQTSQPPHVTPCNAPPRSPGQISEEPAGHPADDEDARTVRSVPETTTGGAMPGLAHRPLAAARAAAEAPRPAGERPVPSKAAEPQILTTRLYAQYLMMAKHILLSYMTSKFVIVSA